MTVGSTAESAQDAGQRVFDLFCTPPAGFRDGGGETIPARALDRLADAERHDVAFAHGQSAVYDLAPVAAPVRGTVAAVHGWGSRAALMSSFIPALREAGYRVVCIDFPGHGAAPGNYLHVPWGTEALAAVYDRTGPWQGIIGHSFGGAVAWTLATGRYPGEARRDVGRLVLVAAPNSMMGVFHRFGASQGLTPQGQAVMDHIGEEIAGTSLAGFDAGPAIAAAGVPTLALHAPEDDEIPFEDAEEMVATGDGHVQLTPLPGLGHRRICFSPKTVKAAVGFLAG